MTTVLIVDPDDTARLSLESQLSQSNQFERVLSCASLEQAQSMVSNHAVKVLLVDARQASNSSALKALQASFPELGVVLLQAQGGMVDARTLQALGAHAQTVRMASAMEIVASVAKALVARLKPGKSMLGKFLKDN